MVFKRLLVWNYVTCVILDDFFINCFRLTMSIGHTLNNKITNRYVVQSMLFLPLKKRVISRELEIDMPRKISSAGRSDAYAFLLVVIFLNRFSYSVSESQVVSIYLLFAVSICWRKKPKFLRFIYLEFNSNSLK